MSSSDTETARSLVVEGREHYRLQRPLAAWASWRRALGFVADFAPARQALSDLEKTPQFPAAAKTVLRFQPPSTPRRRQRRDRLFKNRDLEDLEDASTAFAELAEQDPDDDPAWYNYAVCLAWLGRNLESVRTFHHVVALRAAHQFDAAVEAWTLAEVLRQGDGAESLSDDLAYAWLLDCDEATAEEWLSSWIGMVPMMSPIDPATGQPPPGAPRAFTWLDRAMPAPSDDMQLRDLPRVLAQVLKFPNRLRLSSPDPIMLDRVFAHITAAYAGRIRPVRREATPLPLPLLDAALWNFRLPPGLDAQTEARLRRSAVEHYYEDAWVLVSRHALDGMTPLQAAQAMREGNPVARAKLTAVVRFREQLGERPWTANLYQGYPFDRLRRRLSLEFGESSTVDPDDPTCMSVQDLDRVETGHLDETSLIEAYESASALRDDRLTARFAAELTRRNPPGLSRVDTPSLVATLVREAMKGNDTEAALHWLDQARGLNGGRDCRTFDVWSAEILARTGDPVASSVTFERLLAGDPANARLALNAAETLLNNGYPRHARPFLLQARDLGQQASNPEIAGRAESLLDAEPFET